MTDSPLVLEHFEIVRILGKGGMGTVHLARDKTLGRQVAIKVLNAEDLSSPDRRARFLREARTAAAIRHHNVATIHEVGETPEGQPFIVMEYCEGETLAQRIRRQTIDGPEFLAIAGQIAAGVAAAHENGVVHRDLKASNIIIEPTGLVKILDFGLARLLPREGLVEEQISLQTGSGHFFGTLPYLSPEQARGHGADERSDLFSLGVVFYQMATGQFPFNGDSPLLLLERIRDSEPDPFVPLDPNFPPSAAKIIGRLLQKDPADRYQRARDLLVELEQIDMPTATYPVHHTTRSSIGRTLPRPRWRQVAVLAVALMALGFGVYYTRHNAPNANAEGRTVYDPIRSMAVLPLDNLAKTNTRDDFLSVGLADALVTKLQQVPPLQVRPTSAVLEYRNQKLDAKSAGEKLRVDGILEGHFLAAGDLVRVNLQLTDTRSGYSIWAGSVDGKRTDLLKLIDDVSTHTVDGLRERLGVQPVAAPRFSEPRSKNSIAYEEYLRARALNGSLVRRDFEAQVSFLRRAIELDPAFAAAYADLAIALSLGQARSLTDDPDALKKSEWYARQAVRLDPNLPLAHVALGRAFTRQPGRFREAIRESLAALRLDPNHPDGLTALLSYVVATGELQKAECLLNRISRVDPSSNDLRTRGYIYVNSVEPDAAIEASKYAMEVKETQLAAHDIRALAHLMRDHVDEAEREASAAAEIAPSHYAGKSLRAMVAAARGNRAAAEAAIASFEADANRVHWAALRIGLAYAKLGDRQKAVQWVERAAQLGNHAWYSLVKHPWFASLQNDPRFQTVLTGMRTDLDDVRDDVAGVHQLLCP